MKSNKNKKPGSSDFLRYRSGEMKGGERNSFEKELQRDPFADEAAEGFGMISPEEAAADLRMLRTKLEGRKRSKRMLYYRIAASIAMLMVLSTIFLLVERGNLKEGPFEIAQNMTREMEIIAAAPIVQGEQTIEEASDKKEIPSQVRKRIAANEDSGKKDEAVPEKEKEEIKELQVLEEQLISDAAAPVSAIPKKSKLPSGLQPETRSGISAGQTLRGIVRSAEDGQPVPGATILIRGTTIGTITGNDGSFTINPAEININNNIDNNKYNNINNNITLVASYIGMNTEEIKAVPGKPVEIVMEPDAQALSEIVVVGYGAGKAEEEVEDESYSPPKPENGRSAYNKYIEDNIRRPDTTTAGQRVVVVAGFKVRKDGTPASIRIIRSPGEQFSSEAIRLIETGPQWIPAQRNGEIIEDEVRLRIVFR